jgi:hypothetical protein
LQLIAFGNAQARPNRVNYIREVDQRPRGSSGAFFQGSEVRVKNGRASLFDLGIFVTQDKKQERRHGRRKAAETYQEIEELNHRYTSGLVIA